METLAWLLLWVMVFGGGYWAFLKVGRTALTRHLSKQTPEPDPKTLLAEARSLKEAEKERWQAEFQAILQRTCLKHEYKDRSWNWYKCIHCEHEQEWRYSGSCSCRTVYQKTLTDASFDHVLLARSPYCQIHGRETYLKTPLPHRYQAQ